MNILITICARGGSKGIPGKNTKILNGLPLIAYTINIAKKFQDHFKTVDIELSTDSEEIKRIAKEYGITTEYSRPEFLASDSAGKIDTIKDIVNYSEEHYNKQYKYILDLDVTSPLRNLDDLLSAFKLLQNDTNAINLFSVSPANRNPYFNMVEKKENGYFSLIKKISDPLLTRQASPEVYDLNASFYFYKRSFFIENFNTPITDATLIYNVPHICFDLDHQIDFEFISFLIQNKKLDFEL